MPQHILLRNFQALGDIVMLTASIRDLHKCYPGQYVTSVETSCDELWNNNPYVFRGDLRSDTVTIDCHYPLIHLSDSRPLHFLHGFTTYIGDCLGKTIDVTEFRGDIHLSASERDELRLKHDFSVVPDSYWLVVAGGKRDATTKIWPQRYWQEVIDSCKSQVTFVQVGSHQDLHPNLEGVIDLRGRTTIRDLLRLIFHSRGVLCHVTGAMHLASAVPVKAADGRLRPCVVIAGGRESNHWESYIGHQFLHTIGMLKCCARGGCWKARVVPLGDGSDEDRPEALCVNVVDTDPYCMRIISPADVIAHVLNYERHSW